MGAWVQVGRPSVITLGMLRMYDVDGLFVAKNDIHKMKKTQNNACLLSELMITGIVIRKIHSPGFQFCE